MSEEMSLLTVKEVCTLLSVGRTLFYEILGTGELTAIKIGSSTRVRRSDVENWLRSRPRFRKKKNNNR